LNPFSWFAFHSARRLESLFSPEALAAMLEPAGRLAGRGFAPGEDDLRRLGETAGAEQSPKARSREHALQVLDRMAACWPDRFGEAKWRQRCGIPDIDLLRGFADEGRPVILPTFHFGPMFLTRHLLRSHGLPVASLVSAPRSRFHLEKDRLAGGEWPHFFMAETDLKQVVKWLGSGGMLIIAVDVPARRSHVIKTGGESDAVGCGICAPGANA
jgi:hypothetical protein